MAFLLRIACGSGIGQEEPPPREEHVHHAGLLLGAVYNLHEARWVPGLGAEFEYVIPRWNRLLGIGIGAEMVFDEHRHYVFSLLFPVHPTEELTLFVSPGIMFIEHEPPGRRFAVHFGMEYEFDLEKYFLAPEFEIAWAGDDIHLMLGIHFGFGF